MCILKYFVVLAIGTIVAYMDMEISKVLFGHQLNGVRFAHQRSLLQMGHSMHGEGVLHHLTKKMYYTQI